VIAQLPADPAWPDQQIYRLRFTFVPLAVQATIAQLLTPVEPEAGSRSGPLEHKVGN
jgi:hypothetical protein